MSEASDAQATPKRPVGRSPSYPRLSLPAAIQRVESFHAVERQHPTPVVTAVGHWGYKGLSGPANAAVAALKKFGLITDEGSGETRKIRVTDLAVTILRDPDSAARQQAIQAAALRPPIHLEMWSRYENALPSDDNLAWDLERDRGFTESGAREFLAEYRETIQFARLGATVAADPDVDDDHGDGGEDEVDHEEGDHKKGDDEDDHEEGDPNGDDQRGRSRRNKRPRRSGVVTISLPLPTFGPDEPVTVEFPGKIPEGDWDFFITLITGMKKGVVEEAPPEDD